MNIHPPVSPIHTSTCIMVCIHYHTWITMPLQELLLVSLVMLLCHGSMEGSSIFQSPTEAFSHGVNYFDTSSVTADAENSLRYGTQRSFLEDKDQVGSSETSIKVVNVNDYGAKGNGFEDTEAFKKAWKEACSCAAPAILLVPLRKYLLKPVIFYGPCKSDVKVMIKGTLEASLNRSEWKVNNARHWILFRGINNLVVEGGGTLNGNGGIWWQHSCKINKALPCVEAPTALAFYECSNLKVHKLNIKDSQQIHMLFEKCVNIQASHLTITAPKMSPNTDGIHVANTKNMKIADCIVGTGDDCISIVTGSQNINVTNIICGPGHGISIGSLGANNSEARVRNVMVDTAVLHDTTNGVRIKTWQGGYGHAKNIIFQNIVMRNVQNPIVVDQNYCDSKDPCNEQYSAVKISSVVYKNIRGTSASEYAMAFTCSRSFPCRQVLMQDINLVRENGDAAKSLCKHVKWTTEGQVVPPPCM